MPLTWAWSLWLWPPRSWSSMTYPWLKCRCFSVTKEGNIELATLTPVVLYKNVPEGSALFQPSCPWPKMACQRQNNLSISCILNTSRHHSTMSSAPFEMNAGVDAQVFFSCHWMLCTRLRRFHSVVDNDWTSLLASLTPRLLALEFKATVPSLSRFYHLACEVATHTLSKSLLRRLDVLSVTPHIGHKALEFSCHLF